MFVPKEGRQLGLASPDLQFTLGERAPLSQLLTHEAVAVMRGTSVESVAVFMLRMGLNTLPVVDADGHLLGTVSTHDLLAEAAADRGLWTASIGDVMTPSTLALRDDAAISHAVMALTRAGKSELPVRCERCQGYCIVSALELLAWLSRSRQEAR